MSSFDSSKGVGLSVLVLGKAAESCSQAKDPQIRADLKEFAAEKFKRPAERSSPTELRPYRVKHRRCDSLKDRAKLIDTSSPCQSQGVEVNCVLPHSTKSSISTISTEILHTGCVPSTGKTLSTLNNETDYYALLNKALVDYKESKAGSLSRMLRDIIVDAKPRDIWAKDLCMYFGQMMRIIEIPLDVEQFKVLDANLANLEISFWVQQGYELRSISR